MGHSDRVGIEHKKGRSMEKDFAREIEARKALIASTCEQMAKMRADFTMGLEPFARNWIETIARQYVERNPAKTLELGMERLALLKARVHQLCEGVDRICQEVFSNESFWPETRDLAPQNQLGVRIILGKLGMILEEFGYVKTKAQTELDHESWTQYDSAGDRRQFDGTPIYPHAVELPDALVILLEEYRILMRKKEILLEEIKGLDFEAMKIKAVAMWDSV